VGQAAGGNSLSAIMTYLPALCKAKHNQTMGHENIEFKPGGECESNKHRVRYFAFFGRHAESGYSIKLASAVRNANNGETIWFSGNAISSGALCPR
jgi:hypothetical protein